MVYENVEALKFSSDLDAHERAMSMKISEVVKDLVDLLGAGAVAQIGGVAETRAVAQWMADREPQRPHVLRFALQVANMISTPHDREVARAWFHGSNPRLNDAIPLVLLHTRPLEEIQLPLLMAARAFALRRAHFPHQHAEHHM